MNARTQTLPLDPFAPGVKASDVPIVKSGLSIVRSPEPAPTGAQIATDFITKLFGEATESPIHFCSFGNERNGEHKPKSVNTRIPDQLSAFMAKWDIDGRGIFFGVGTLKDANIERSKANISEVSMLHADIDLKDVDETVEEIERKLRNLKHLPSVMVFSGNGVHAYWKLTESIHNPVDNGEVDRIETALRQICDVVGGDLQVCEIARVMRLPGSHNTKFGKRTPVAVVHSTDIKYELSDLEEWLAEQSPVILRKERPRAITLGEMDGFDLYLREIGFKTPIDVEKRLNGMMYMGFEEASVHWTQRDVTASMLSKDHSIDEVVDILIQATKTAAGQYGERWIGKR